MYRCCQASAFGQGIKYFLDEVHLIPPEAFLTVDIFQPVWDNSATIARKGIRLIWSKVIPELMNSEFPITVDQW